MTYIEEHTGVVILYEIYETDFSKSLPHGAIGWSAECDCGISWSYSFTCSYIVRPVNRDWACQTEHCHTLSNKTSLQ